MPKYFEFKIFGYFLYFTAHCIVEAMHVHANSDGRLNPSAAAKFFVKNNGDTIVEKEGNLPKQDIVKIQRFIKENYKTMYEKWASYSAHGFYEK